MANATYAINYRAQELRVHGTPNRIRFMAASDAAATAVAAVFNTGSSSDVVVARQTSLVKRIITDASLGGTHKAGSANTAHMLMRDANGAVWRFIARNVADATTDALLKALVLGTASGPVAALVTPPALPNSGVVVASVPFAYTIVRH